MSRLNQIEKGRQVKPPRVTISGLPGVGKTTFASFAPRVIYVPTEDGLGQIECERFPLAQSVEDVFEALEELHTGEHDYQTVAVDTLDWLERFIWDAVCKEYRVTSIEKADGGYQRGYVHALTYWRKFVDALTKLRDDRGMMILLIAHSKVERFEDPEAPAYDRYTPRLHKHACALITEWSDAVLFATRKFRTETEDRGFGRERTIAVGVGADGGERILRCVGSPACVAKNRYGLPAEIPLSWDALMAGLTAGVQTDAKAEA